MVEFAVVSNATIAKRYFCILRFIQPEGIKRIAAQRWRNTAVEGFRAELEEEALEEKESWFQAQVENEGWLTMGMYKEVLLHLDWSYASGAFWQRRFCTESSGFIKFNFSQPAKHLQEWIG